MSGILDLLSGALGDDAHARIGRQLGTSPQATGSAIQAALPMLLSALSSNAGRSGGAESLLGALQRDGHGGLLDDVSGYLGGQAQGRAANGAGILGHLLGDRQPMAQQAVAKAGGLDGAQAAQLLAMLAPLVMGAVGRMQQQRGLDAGGLASMLQGERAQVAQAQPDLMGLANRLLDRDGDGSALDDVMKGLGGLFGKR
jgi:hypothetical protein